MPALPGDPDQLQLRRIRRSDGPGPHRSVYALGVPEDPQSAAGARTGETLSHPHGIDNITSLGLADQVQPVPSVPSLA